MTAGRVVMAGQAIQQGKTQQLWEVQISDDQDRLVAVEKKPIGTQLTTEIHVHVVGQERPALIYVMLVLYHPAPK